MQISISDPVSQTILFTTLFLLASLYLMVFKKPKALNTLSNDWTNELKGFAILVIIFSHIGYFLSKDPHFLFPLSALAGVGVNLFLLLSGFGLTLSQISKPLPPWEFYKKRLKKLFIPLWLVLVVFFVTDYLLLHINHSFSYVSRSFLGFFPSANLFEDINSPLWYFTWIFFYYLAYPWVIKVKPKLLAPFLLLLISWLVTLLPLPVNIDTHRLYSLHFWAFPLGLLLALGRSKIEVVTQRLGRFSKVVLLSVLILIFAYLCINSGVNTSLEQQLSIVNSLVILGIFLLKSYQLRIFSVFGLLSYEIYLIHWPILSRYDLLYPHLPAGVATALYLLLFLILAKALSSVASLFG